MENTTTHKAFVLAAGMMWMITLPFRLAYYLLAFVCTLLAQLVILPYMAYRRLFDAELVAGEDGHKFEYVCADVLRGRGFRRVHVTKGSGDQGADIIAFRGDRKYAIQCKYYTEPVGNHAVQEVYAGREFYGCDAAAVMTNSTFTRGARELADVTGVELWPRCPVCSRRKRSRAFFWLSLIAAIAALGFLDYRLQDARLYYIVPLCWLVLIAVYVLLTIRR